MPDPNRQSGWQRYRSKHGHNGVWDSPRRKIICRFSDEDMKRIRMKATKEKIPIAEAIRLYVTWGMEAEDDADRALTQTRMKG